MRTGLTVALVVANVAMVVISNVSFKFSALSAHWRGFLAWQVVGNLAGFASVLSLTFLLKQIPLNAAYALSAGLGFVLVEVVGARFIFHEAVSATQWFGVMLVTGGILLIFQGRPH